MTFPKKEAAATIMATAVFWVLALASNTALAQAEVREATVADPADAAPTLSGIPNNPDIESATVAYDTNGSIRITVNFYHPFSALDTSENYAFFTGFSIGEGEGEVNYAGEQDCLFSAAAAREGQYLLNGAVYGKFTDYSYNDSTYPSSFWIGGLQGESAITVSVAPNDRSVTAVGTAPGLAGRDYRCFELDLQGNARSYASNPYSTWDEGCGCWAVGVYLDNLGVMDSGEDRIADEKPLWFNGFARVAPMTPPTAAPDSKSEAELKRLSKACSNARASKEKGRRAYQRVRLHLRRLARHHLKPSRALRHVAKRRQAAFRRAIHDARRTCHAFWRANSSASVENQ